MADEDIFKNALQERVRKFKNNPSLSLDFTNGKLNQHIATDDQARVVVTDATSAAAKQLDRVLNSTGRQIVRDSISVNTGYGAAVKVMDDAFSNGTDPKVGIG